MCSFEGKTVQATEKTVVCVIEGSKLFNLVYSKDCVSLKTDVRLNRPPKKLNINLTIGRLVFSWQVEKRFPAKSSIQTDNKLLHERQCCQSQEWYGCKCDHVGYDVYYSGRCFRRGTKRGTGYSRYDYRNKGTDNNQNGLENREA